MIRLDPMWIFGIPKDSHQDSQQLFFAPFIVLSHDTQASPILNYGNQATLNLWETDWETFTKMPSRQTVAPEKTQEQVTREQMLKIVQEQGYITNYEGIRINSQGKLLKITEMTVWNIFDENNSYCGQGATCVKWSCLWFLTSSPPHLPRKISGTLCLVIIYSDFSRYLFTQVLRQENYNLILKTDLV